MKTRLHLHGPNRSARKKPKTKADKRWAGKRGLRRLRGFYRTPQPEPVRRIDPASLTVEQRLRILSLAEAE